MSNGSLLVIDAGILYTPFEKISAARVVADNGRIVEVGPADRVPAPAAAHRIDASGLTLAPGFIEPHIHGCGGVDVMDGSFEALNTVSRIVARHGTTSFLPTTVSSPSAGLTVALTKIGESISRRFGGAAPLGIHLEGPFINSVRRGTHRSLNLLPPDPELMSRWITASKSTIRLITIAPELDEAGSIAALAAQHGIRVAMGHSNASLAEAGAAADRGICYAVHTFNAMRDFTHRDPGIVGAVLADDRIFAEIIADGIHVHPAVVRFFARAKRAERILLVTDAMSAADMPDGDYTLGPDTVSVKNGVCRDAEGRLAGSTLTQDIALKNFVEWTGFPIEDALLALTTNPAKALGLAGKGVIEAGADADMTILDSNFHVMKTLVAGKLVFER